MREFNPYTPGAGRRPTVLAGRDKLIGEIDYSLHNMQHGYPQRSVIYYGLRGVGKTVLLGAIEDAAENRNMVHAYIEATENQRFKSRLITALTRFTTQLSAKEAAKNLAQRCASLLRAFKISYGLNDNSVSVSLDANPMDVTGDYEDDLTEVFVQLGNAAKQADTPVCIFIDEMQYLENDDISALIGAIHRCNQLRLPIMMFCAGLPIVKKKVGDARSYSERLFSYEEIGALDTFSATDVITGPAEEFGVKFTNEAIKEILDITKMYPYFLQEMCSVVWSRTGGPQITDADIFAAADEFYSQLDRGFFSVRYERCSHGERSFMTAMVKSGELPCTISNVAMIMGKSVRSISPTRGKLINKGLIYATGHAEIDFTVPQFDGFLQRQNPDLVL